jgi:hypothetical protein
MRKLLWTLHGSALTPPLPVVGPLRGWESKRASAEKQLKRLQVWDTMSSLSKVTSALSSAEGRSVLPVCIDCWVYQQTAHKLGQIIRQISTAPDLVYEAGSDPRADGCAFGWC